VAGASIEARVVRLTLRLPGGASEIPASLRDAIVERLAGAGFEARLAVAAPKQGEDGESAAGAAAARPTAEALPGVRTVLAVSSTKGGVGKSTVATNLACAFAAIGLRTGLLDADVYGPSLPVMLGIDEKPAPAGGSRFYPIERYGVRCMSMGFFLDESSPVIWRGAMVTGLLRQFLSDCVWGELDVLVIDLPPGTGDAHLTLVQQIEIRGALIVTTPQDVALRDVMRGAAMFRQVQVPILGIVENMSFLVCPECGEQEETFGHGGGAQLAELTRAPLLAQIPLDASICAQADQGRPVVLAAPRSTSGQIFLGLAQRLATELGVAPGADAPARA
jgi:ATP-binding protein involved in chromosome partitioning